MHNGRIRVDDDYVQLNEARPVSTGGLDARVASREA